MSRRYDAPLPPKLQGVMSAHYRHSSGPHPTSRASQLAPLSSGMAIALIEERIMLS